MKLSISNIAWHKKNDEKIYKKMKELNFKYLEIAPTRWIFENPYKNENIKRAKEIAYEIEKEYEIKICSMQSILYGVNERLFHNANEREILKNRVKESIDYARGIGCKNIVFGSPKNRKIENKNQYEEGVYFFRELAEYSEKREVFFSIEANPAIYGTNYINTTEEALELVEEVKNNNFGINYDLGTVIQNNENIEFLENNLDRINHIHISEPYLEKIKERDIHKKLYEILKEKNYKNVISIEMKKIDEIKEIYNVLDYVSKIFL